MKTPPSIFNKVYDHYQASDWCLIILNQSNQIIHFNQNTSDNFQNLNKVDSIQSQLPLLAAETLEDEFIIPFFNHNDKIFDVHFLLQDDLKYLILVPIDMLHKQVQFKQQVAHEQVIERLKLQSLFATLENAHDELKEANSAKSFYISALSHEIGNPINAIKGYNQLLQEESISKAKATSIINNNIEKIQQIITQTLDYDQQYNTQYNVKINPAKKIDELFNDFKIQAQNKNLQLINEIDPSISINTNRTKWTQIFTNLISNAIKYTEQGSIKLISIIEDDLLHIDTIDTGSGMSQQFQNQLFTAWSREQDNQSNGNGIGLVISKMLAEQLGGDLLLHSSSTKGSRFRFSVNYFKPLNSYNILLVDDDYDCLNLFNYYLSQAGHQIKTADSIKSIKKQLEKNKFDIIVTDLNLTDGKADQIIKELNTKIKKTIVMTANPTNEKRDALYQAGFDQVLSKPLNQEQLVNSVSK